MANVFPDGWRELAATGAAERELQTLAQLASRHLMGGDDTKAKLPAHHGVGLIQPHGREYLPQPEFLAWHRAEVFEEPARE